MAFSIVYDLFLVFYFLFQIPFMLRRISEQKVKKLEGIEARFVGPWPEKDLLRRKSIWIHSVSLGESKAILPIIQKIQSRKIEGKNHQHRSIRYCF